MLNTLKWATRQRLQFIELTAYYLGFISRGAVASAFAMSAAAATKDLRLYKQLAPGNLVYSHKLFGFVPGEDFRPVLAELSAASVLPLLELGLLGGIGVSPVQPGAWGIPVSTTALPARLPQHAVLAQLTRAIHGRRKLAMQYHSLSDGDDGQRIIEPHALINTGLRWHVRAYNVRSFDFRDFVLSRIRGARCLEEEAESDGEHDEDWTERITLRLRPHPGLGDRQRANLLLDYGAADDRIDIELRRALTGYTLQALSVDTSVGHTRPPRRYPLVLANREEIEVYAAWALE